MSTFSIAAWDPVRGDWGAAVQSNYLAVGALVPFVRAGVGVVLTQATASRPLALAALAELQAGQGAARALACALARDDRPAERQLAVLDGAGAAAAHTGGACSDQAGHVAGERYLCVGNTLHPGTLAAMAEAFEAAGTARDGELADWLLAALEAGATAGGDRRGELAAALQVARRDGGFGGDNDRYLDLRVDAHARPMAALARLVALHHLYYRQPGAGDWQALAGLDAQILGVLAQRAGVTAPALQAREAGVASVLARWLADHNIEHAFDPRRWQVRRELADYLSVLDSGSGVPSKSSQFRVSKQ